MTLLALPASGIRCYGLMAELASDCLAAIVPPSAVGLHRGVIARLRFPPRQRGCRTFGKSPKLREADIPWLLLPQGSTVEVRCT